jgi:hypothetical protein
MLQNYNGENHEKIIKSLENITNSGEELLGYEKDLVGKLKSDNSVALGDKIREIGGFLRNNGSNVSREINEIIGAKSNVKKIKGTLVSLLNKNMDSKHRIVFSTERFIEGKRALIGGLADRLKGASTVMMMSIALGRRFEIEWKHPEELHRLFVPTEYDWQVRSDSGELFDVDLIDVNFSSEIRLGMLQGKIDEILGIRGKDARIFCNSIELGISENSNHLMHDIESIVSNNSRTYLVGTLLSLLEYRPGLEETMMLMVFLSRLRSFGSSVAVHFRTGGDGGWRDPEMDESGNVEVLLKRAKDIGSESGGRSCVYFACDSDKVKREVLEKYSEEMEIFSLNIPLAHIDRSQDEGAIMGSRFAMMENYMISLCDNILTGKGAFAELAANRRFVEPWRYFE